MVFSDLFSRNMALVSFSALCLMGLTGTSLPARAADVVGPGCDPAFMEAMKSKAWMEAQREIMIAQSQIAKPDSVFALGCFGSFSSDSRTGSFSSGPNSQYQIGNKVKSYVKAAFAHSYGGGHYAGAGSNDGSNSDCGLMQTIWNLARCSDSPTTQLASLQSVSSYNRGAFPKACGTASGWSTNKTTIYGTKAAGKSVGAAFDDMKLFTDKTAAVSLTSGKTCADGIPTGIKMGDVAEVICPNPGCYPSAGKCEKK